MNRNQINGKIERIKLYDEKLLVNFDSFIIIIILQFTTTLCTTDCSLIFFDYYNGYLM